MLEAASEARILVVAVPGRTWRAGSLKAHNLLDKGLRVEYSI